MSGRERSNGKDTFWATGLNRMEAGVRGIVREIQELVENTPILSPHLWPGSGWRTGSSEHSSGTAIDWICVANTGSRPSSEERKAMLELIHWMTTNHKALGLEGVLFSRDGKSRTEVWGYSTPGRGWRNLKDRGSVSGNHIDHAHFKFYSGASWPSSLNGSVIGGSTIIPPWVPGLPATGVGKTISQMATEVINGQHGNGHTNRQRSLGVPSDEYAQVRAEVNRRTGMTSTTTPPKVESKKSVPQMAVEVINGQHGTGHERRRRSLGIDSVLYEQVRREVNRRVSISPSNNGKSIAKMASEVIQGLHGNGHTTRRRSLGVSESVYKRVRAEVNRIV